MRERPRGKIDTILEVLSTGGLSLLRTEPMRGAAPIDFDGIVNALNGRISYQDKDHSSITDVEIGKTPDQKITLRFVDTRYYKSLELLSLTPVGRLQMDFGAIDTVETDERHVTLQTVRSGVRNTVRLSRGSSTADMDHEYVNVEIEINQLPHPSR